MSESAVLEYLEAQILKFYEVGRRQPWWRLCGFDMCPGLPKNNAGHFTAGMPSCFTYIGDQSESAFG